MKNLDFFFQRKERAAKPFHEKQNFKLGKNCGQKSSAKKNTDGIKQSIPPGGAALFRVAAADSFVAAFATDDPDAQRVSSICTHLGILESFALNPYYGILPEG